MKATFKIMSIHLAFAALLCLCGGEMAVAHGTHEERVELYSEKIKRDPMDVHARHELAMALVENGDWKLAILQLDAADKLKGADSPLDFGVTRARAFAAGGRMKSALKILNTYLGKLPEDADALVERARVRVTLGDPAGGLSDYQESIARIPRPSPELFLEVADVQMRGNRADDAIALIQQSIKVNGDVPSLLFKAIELDLGAGRYDDALKWIDTLARLMPRPEPMMARKAEVLAIAGRTEQSHQAWDALVRHIDALPNLQRGSPAMSALSTRARLALVQDPTPAQASTAH